MLLFAASAILGVVSAYDPGLSVPTLVAILGSTILYFVIANLGLSPGGLRVIGVATLVAAATFGLYIVTQYGYLGYTKGGVIARLGWMTTLMPDLHGFQPKPNAAGTFLDAAVPLGIALTVSSRGMVPRAALAAATLIVVYAIFLTVSRGSWSALMTTGSIATAPFFSGRLPRAGRFLVIGGGFVFLAAAILGVAALGPDRLPFLASTFASASSRGTLFRNSLYLAGDYPFTGAGLGDTFAMVYSRYSLLIHVPFLNYAHNLPLSVWLSQGLPGLMASAAILVTFYGLVIRILGHGQPPALFHGAWLGVTAVLLHGLTDAPQYSPNGPWVMPMAFVALGLAAGSGRWTIPETAPPVGSRPWYRRRAVGATAALAFVALITIANQPLRAAWDTNIGAMDETRGELTPGLSDDQRAELYGRAQREYRDALAVDSGYSNAARRLGNLLVKQDSFDDAVPLLEAALHREPGNPAAIKGLGLAYVWVGRPHEAASLFLQLGQPSDMPAELQYWGQYRSRQGKPLLAAYAFEAYLALVPRAAAPDAWLRIADAYRLAGRPDTARDWYRRVLAANPNNEPALRALAEIGQ